MRLRTQKGQKCQARKKANFLKTFALTAAGSSGNGTQHIHNTPFIIFICINMLVVRSFCRQDKKKKCTQKPCGTHTRLHITYTRTHKKDEISFKMPTHKPIKKNWGETILCLRIILILDDDICMFSFLHRVCSRFISHFDCLKKLALKKGTERQRDYRQN